MFMFSSANKYVNGKDDVSFLSGLLSIENIEMT